MLTSFTPAALLSRPFQSWDEWPSLTRAFFEAQRSPAGEDLILEKNLLIEYLLPLRGVSSQAIEVYRRYFRIPGASRARILPQYIDLRILTWQTFLWNSDLSCKLGIGIGALHFAVLAAIG